MSDAPNPTPVAAEESDPNAEASITFTHSELEFMVAYLTADYSDNLEYILNEDDLEQKAGLLEDNSKLADILQKLGSPIAIDEDDEAPFEPDDFGDEDATEGDEPDPT
jgi:hypothetical protein